MDKTSIVADALVNSGALKFGAFTLKSRQTSPFYLDLASLLSSPKDFQSIVTVIANEIASMLPSGKIDKLASIELKGAVILPSVAAKLDLPCLMVRKETKEYGVTGRIAGGEVRKGERILFMDDVITDGKSKIEALKPLLQAEAMVEKILVVIDREQGGKQNLEQLGYELHAVTKLSKIIKNLAHRRKITEEQARIILNYIKQED